MKRLFPIILFFSLISMSVFSQGTMRGMRTISDQENSGAVGIHNQVQSVRIDEGKVWLNGNLASNEELPVELQNLETGFSFQASMFGGHDLTFNLMGHDFLLKDGRLITLAKVAVPAEEQAAKEAYYSKMKNDFPGQFYNQSREALVYEKCMRMVMQAQLAEPAQRALMEKEIKEMVGELFDISMRNQEAEIKELKKILDAAQAEIDHRRINRETIIQNRLDELMGN